MTSSSWPRGPSEQVCKARRIVEVLEHRAQRQPDRVIYTYLGQGGQVAEALTFGQLFEDASRVATRLLMHVTPGTPVMLLFASSLEFIKAFMGCQIAGVPPVPVMPPRKATAAEAQRVTAVLRDIEATVVLANSDLVAMAQALFGDHPEFSALSWLGVDALDGLALTPVCTREDAGELALLQYTSGSTSRPRGIMVGHDNLMSNLGDIYWAEQNHEDTISVSWLPMTHDMGLIEGVLQPLYSGHRAYLMSPADFLKRPLCWLEALSTYRATVSGGPNFAYDLVLRDLGDEMLPDYDLSSWQFAYNGAEPLSATTMERFTQRLLPCGFHPSAFAPVYGLAEATVGVTVGRRGRAPRHQHRVDGGSERRVVSCGVPPAQTCVLIVDPETSHRLVDGVEGEIWVHGPSVTRGYWRSPEQTDEVFGATLQGEPDRCWLRTGDLGFMLDGELFVSGRRKEVIVCRGQNIYPQDLEATASQAHALIRPGGVVAFRVDQDGDEAAVLIAEVDRHAMNKGVSLEHLEAAARIVRSRVASTHAVAVEAVVLVRAGTVPRTTSGKRQRLWMREVYERGQVEPLALAARAVGPPGEGVSGAVWLRSYVATILGVGPSALDPEKTLTALGMDSLRAMELLMELDGMPKFAHMNLVQVLTLSWGDLLARLDSPLHAQTACSWHEDAHLEQEESTPDCEVATVGTSVLLSGATGFLGAHVAIELLASTRSTVRCLVRGDGGRTRLLTALAEHPDWESSWGDRIEVLQGDLDQIDLGLTKAHVAHIVADTCAIYHCAAMVNWAYPYEALRQANVEGTRALIRLAFRARASLTYVSTLAACWSYGHQECVDETSDPVRHLDGIHLDYVRSKAVAESLVRQAGARGLPVSILRPGLVFSHARTKAHRPGDFLSALFKGCIEMGAAPDLDWTMEVCTVDEAARWIVALEPTTGEHIPALHLGAASPRLWRGLVLWMNLRGYPVRLMPYDLWCDVFKEHASHPAAALRPLFEFFLRPVNACDGLRLPQLYESHRQNPIDSTTSQGLLAKTPRAPFDAFHVQQTLNHLTQVGYLPAVPDPPSHQQDETHAQMACEAMVHEHLCQRHSGAAIKALQVHWLSSEGTGHGIISELASWRFGKTTGIHRLALTYECEGHTHTLGAVLKAQVKDVHALEIADHVASLCGSTLREAWRTHRAHQEIWRSHLREAALYQIDDPRLRVHTPALYGACPGMLLLEDISDFPMLNRISCWKAPHLESAVAGLAKIHAIVYGDAPPVAKVPAWWPPERTGKALVAQMPLFRALLDFALSRPMGQWLQKTGCVRVRTLLETLPDWAHAMDTHPHTMIHNDCNPRNLAFHPDGTLCAFDWELARHGLPQRDLCELLCFTLDQDVTAKALEGWVTMHREHLEAHTGCAIDQSRWRQGFSLALADLMVTRLTMYAMLDYVHPQPFLKRVVNTWARLDALWADTPGAPR